MPITFNTLSTSPSSDSWIAIGSSANTSQYYSSTGAPTGGNYYDSIIWNIAIDTNNNINCVGWCQGYGSAPGSKNFIFQLNKYGYLNWQTLTLDAPSSYIYAQGGGVDSFGNIYLTTQADNGIANSQFYGLRSFNSSGTGLNAFNLGSGSTINRFNCPINSAVDTNGNIYSIGYANDGTNSGPLLAKWNSSGTLQFQSFHGITGATAYDTQFGYSSYNFVNSGITITPAGNITFGINATVTNIAGFIHQVNSSGTLQWQTKLAISGTNIQITGLASDSSNNIGFCGFTAGGSGNGVVGLLNSSGTLVWSRQLNSGSTVSKKVCFDSLGNLYVVGLYFPSAGANGFIAKYNSSGTIQWQRSLSLNAPYPNATYVFQLMDCAIDPAGFLVIGGSFYLSEKNFYTAIVMRVPTDGTKTGTYVHNNTQIPFGTYTFNYTASSLTESAITLTKSTPTDTVTAGALTNAAASTQNTYAPVTNFKQLVI